METILRDVIISSGDLHNVGDLALLLQCAFGVKTHLGARKVLVRQWNTPAPDILRQLEANDIGLVHGKDVVGSMRRSREALVMIGGGQMVRDNASVPSLLSLTGMMEIARRTGGAAAILACGVDRLTKPLHRTLWRRMMTRSKLISVRDAPSQQAVTELCGAATHSVLTADLAFLPSPLHEALNESHGTAPSIVVAPCADHSEKRTVRVDILAETVARTAAKLGLNQVSLVAHDARPDMDPVVCLALEEALARKAPHLKITQVASYALDDYTKVYAAAALVITNRLHALIFGTLAGRPVLVLDDGVAKTRAAAERFSIPLAPIDAPLSEALIERLVHEAANGPSQARRSALDAEPRTSRDNFLLLRTACG